MNTCYVWVMYPIMLDQVISETIPVELIYQYVQENDTDESRIVILIDTVVFNALIETWSFRIVQDIRVKPWELGDLERVCDFHFE